MKKQAVLMKQAVAPLQANEVSIIRRKLATFDVKQHEFRESFRKTAPFPFDSKDIYTRIDWVCTLVIYIIMVLLTHIHIVPFLVLWWLGGTLGRPQAFPCMIVTFFDTRNCTTGVTSL